MHLSLHYQHTRTPNALRVFEVALLSFALCVGASGRVCGYGRGTRICTRVARPPTGQTRARPSCFDHIEIRLCSGVHWRACARLHCADQQQQQGLGGHLPCRQDACVSTKLDCGSGPKHAATEIGATNIRPGVRGVGVHLQLST